MKKIKWLAGIILLVLLMGNISVQIGETKSVAKVTEKEEGIMPNGSIPAKTKVYNKKDLVESKGKYSTASTIPKAYDAREEGIVTEVKNQLEYQTCWAFAALASAETSILKKGLAETVDLSELQLSYSAYNKFIDPLNLTEEDIFYPKELTDEVYNYLGNRYLAARTLTRWQGAVNEVDAPYPKEGKQATVALDDQLMYQKDAFHLQNVEFVYLSTPNRVKQKIMEKGGATFSYHSANTWEEVKLFENESQNAIYTDPEHYEQWNLSVNHDVLVIGWDDDYAISNFNKNNQPKAPGAWLVKGSWGKEYGDDGYYWISYEDAALQDETAEVSFFDMGRADNYDKNYQYDGSYEYLYMQADKAANVFTADNKESLEAVSLWTAERNVSYEINVYKGMDASNPESGEKVGSTISGVVAERGYHTIDFTERGAENIPLSKGEEFAVVVKLLNEDNTHALYSMESDISDDRLIYHISAGEGESFLFCEGAWYDSSITKNANVCLKAFTSVVDDVPCEGIMSNVEEIKVDVNKSKIVDYQLKPVDATGLIVWKSEDCRIASVSNGVVFGHKAGTTAITGTIQGHTMRVPVTVEERPITTINLPQTKELYRNKQERLTPVVIPVDTTDELVWESSNPSLVRVDQEGNIFAIAESDETVTIRATATSGVSASCQVSVVRKDPYKESLEDMESLHPYMTNCSTVYEYARENAIGYKVTFSEDTFFEDNIDFLYVKDETGEIINQYTGDELAGKTITIPCRQINLELFADEGIEGYGFKITNIEPIYQTTARPTATPMPTVSARPTLTATATARPTVTAATTPTVTARPETTAKTTTTATKTLVKSMRFTTATKKIKAGKKIQLSKYLKVVKKKKAKVSFSYSFTKKKYSKYATLSKQGVLKGKKKGKGKTIVVVARAKDGSGKSAKIKVKIG